MEECRVPIRPSGIWNRLVCTVLWGEVEPVLFVLALFSAVMGLWFLNPLWDTFVSVPMSYSGMSAVASENIWGAWFVLLGAGNFWCVGSAHYRKLRRVITFLGLITFCTVGVFFLEANTPSLGAPIFTVLGGTSAWAFFRASLDGKSE